MPDRAQEGSALDIDAVARGLAEFEQAMAENRRLWGGLLVYGNHTQQCGSHTAAACDCGWQKVQMEAEQRA